MYDQSLYKTRNLLINNSDINKNNSNSFVCFLQKDYKGKTEVTKIYKRKCQPHIRCCQRLKIHRCMWLILSVVSECSEIQLRKVNERNERTVKAYVKEICRPIQPV